MIRDPKKHPAAKSIDLERLRKMRLAGKPNAAIAKALGCSTALVSRLALRMGLPRRLVDASAMPAIPTATLAELYQTHGLHELGPEQFDPGPDGSGHQIRMAKRCLLL